MADDPSKPPEPKPAIKGLTDTTSLKWEAPASALPNKKGWQTATVAAVAGFRPDFIVSPKHGYVTVIAGGAAGSLMKLAEGETVFGRAPEATLRIDSEGVSWRHCRVFKAGDSFLIEDLKSTNGTGLNDQKIDFSKLSDGDRIHLGPGVILRFNLYDELEAGVQLQLYESAVRDPLTRAYNRKHFNERLRSEIAYALRHQTPLSMVMFDIDFFKKVNDTHGHPGGDAVLKAVSGAILGVVRVEDIFARVGGEEFSLLARLDAHHAVMFAERLRTGIEGMVIPWEATTIPVTASFGVATISEIAGASGDQPEGDRLVSLSDARLYEAKKTGRNRVVGPPAK